MGRVMFTPNKENAKWLNMMKKKGVDKSSLINLALEVLRPKTANIRCSEESILSTIAERQISRHHEIENLDF